MARRYKFILHRIVCVSYIAIEKSRVEIAVINHGKTNKNNTFRLSKVQLRRMFSRHNQTRRSLYSLPRLADIDVRLKVLEVVCSSYCACDGSFQTRPVIEFEAFLQSPH